jgi:TRAP-type C4-dicarboxylate transport system permease small subunit
MSASDHAITVPTAADPGIAARLDRVIGTALELVTAALVAIEIVILFVGIVARYVFHNPLIWSDELASMLFLWLAMLGAVVAFRRSEHMRMTALVASAGPRLRAYLDLVAICAALAFLLLIVHPAYEYASDEGVITTPALQISNAWRAAALPVGTCLMALLAFLRLIRFGEWRLVVSAALSVAIVIGLFWLAQPLFRPLGNLNW